MKAVITATAFNDADIETAVLESAGFDVVATDVRAPDEIVSAARDATALLVQYAQVGSETLAQLPELRIISRYGVGVDNIDLEAASLHGVLVTNVPSYGGDEVALHATSMILALVRHLPAFDRSVRAGRWHHRVTGAVASPADLTLGILGLGRIGRVVAARAGAWFGTVLAHDPHLSESAEVDLVDLDRLFERSDVVSVHVPLTDETRGLVDRRRLALLGPEGHLVNTARGGIVQLDDLLVALDAGELGGAALDVQPVEPPAANHPILAHPRVLMTPHVGWYSEAAVADLREQAAANVVSWLHGRPQNVIR